MILGIAEVEGGCWCWRGRRHQSPTVDLWGETVPVVHLLVALSGRHIPAPSGENRPYQYRTCGHSWCVRPSHVTPEMPRATRRKIGHGPPRHPRGEQSPEAKLSDADIRILRERVAAGETRASIAKDMGISTGYASKVARGIYRREAGGPIVAAQGDGPPRKVTPTEEAEIIDRRDAGEALTILAEDYGLSVTTISLIVRGASHGSSTD